MLSPEERGPRRLLVEQELSRLGQAESVGLFAVPNLHFASAEQEVAGKDRPGYWTDRAGWFRWTLQVSRHVRLGHCILQVGEADNIQAMA